MVVVGWSAELGVGAANESVGVVVAVGCCVPIGGEGGAVAVFVGVGVVGAGATAWRSVAIAVDITIYGCACKPSSFVVGVGATSCAAAECVCIRTYHAALGAGDRFVEGCVVAEAEYCSAVSL